MKKYSNIPLKERMRNADRVYRHEERLEQINLKRMIREKEHQWSQEIRGIETDKDRQEAEAFARLKALERSNENAD